MSPAPAEQAYLFQHALLREAAYELQPPTDRANLHALALASLETVLQALPGALDASALELANHARLGAASHDDLQARELHYLQIARAYAAGQYRHDVEADCLARILAHPGVTPDIRLRALENMGHNRYRLGRTEDARSCFENLLADARKLHRAPAELAALTGLGQALRALGQIARAAEVLSEAAALAHSQGDQRQHGIALGMRAVLLQQQNQFAPADEAFAAALAAARAVGDRKSEELALGNWASLFLMHFQFDRAQELYEQALAISLQRGDLRTQGIWTGNLALLHGKLGDRPRADAWIEESLRIARRCGDRRTEASMLLNVAVSRLVDTEGPARMRAAQQALDLCAEIQSPPLELRARILLGRCDLEQGRAEQALAALDAAVQTARKLRDPRQQGEALGYGAGALLLLGRKEDYQPRLLQAIECATQASDPESYAGWCVELAVDLRQQGQEQLAQKWYQQGMQALADVHDPAMEARLAAKFGQTP
ncbi:MAG: tetratricopeptide repeat protein [Planctomycetes bacterium]|nr:tetratricopeptide repeat protein [Planctomycetota bacterium]